MPRGGKTRPQSTARAPKRAVQTNQGILKDITGLLPPLDARIAFEHLLREPGEPVTSTFDQGRAGGFIAAVKAVDVALNVAGLILVDQFFACHGFRYQAAYLVDVFNSSYTAGLG